MLDLFFFISVLWSLNWLAQNWIMTQSHMVEGQDKVCQQLRLGLKGFARTLHWWTSTKALSQVAWLCFTQLENVPLHTLTHARACTHWGHCKSNRVIVNLSIVGQHESKIPFWHQFRWEEVGHRNQRSTLILSAVWFLPIRFHWMPKKEAFEPHLPLF